MPQTRSLACVALSGSFVLTFAAAQDLRTLDHSILVSAAYDVARGRPVAIGALGETFEFDGSRWRNAPITPLTALLPRLLAHDPDRQLTYAVAGGTADILTWAHDGIGWRDLAPASSPPPRNNFALAFDSARSELVLFGGARYFNIAYDDTWVFDGTQWLLRQPTTLPSPRYDSVATFDSGRNRTVLFGGIELHTVRRDTYEWDGANWSLVPSATAPPARYWSAFAYDEARQRSVLVGGSPITTAQADVWEFDGQSWQLQTPAPGPAPSARDNCSIVYDAARGECVLVGGQFGGNNLFDTWAWNGQRWLLLDDPLLDRLTGQPLLAHPNTTGLVRLTRNATATETRVFDGIAWATLATTTPPLTWGAATATGASRAYVFGGSDGVGSTLFNDLHMFDGANWTTIAGGANGPSPRTHAAISYDWARQRLVLFGGTGLQTSTTLNDETWTFDGVSWTQQQPAQKPSARFYHTMAFDPLTTRVILHGGRDFASQPLRDTWAWDGNNWSPVAQAVPAPSYSGLAATAWDASRGAVTLISGPSPYATPGPLVAWTLGSSGWNATALGQTAMAMPLAPEVVIGFPYEDGLAVTAPTTNPYSVMRLDVGAATTARYGTACTSTAPTIQTNVWPAIGTNDFAIEVQRAPSNGVALVLGATGPANVAVGSCTQLVLPGQAAALIPTSIDGFAALPVPIPNLAALAGLDLFFQAAVIDATAPNRFSLSRGLRITVGN